MWLRDTPSFLVSLQCSVDTPDRPWKFPAEQHLGMSFVSAAVFIRVDNKQLLTLETQNVILCFGGNRSTTEVDPWHTAMRGLSRRLGIEPFVLTYFEPTTTFEVPLIRSNDKQVFFILDISSAQANAFIHNRRGIVDQLRLVNLDQKIESLPLFKFHRFVLRRALAQQHLVFTQ